MGGGAPPSPESARGLPPGLRARLFPLKGFAMRRFSTAVFLALAGLVLFSQGAYIHAKALLAQVLLQRAFTETIATGRDTKPWSWADTWPVARIEVKRLHASA